MAQGEGKRVVCTEETQVSPLTYREEEVAMP